MRISVPTWLIVAIGLVMNVVAALMTNFVIDQLGERASDLLDTQTSNNQLIQLTWQQADALERRRETLLIIMSSTGKQDVLAQPVLDALMNLIKEQLADSSLSISDENIGVVMTAIDDKQATLRNKINDLYLENLQLSDEYREVSGKISGYRNLALFLQILGLALIMARDLSRKPNG